MAFVDAALAQSVEESRLSRSGRTHDLRTRTISSSRRVPREAERTASTSPDFALPPRWLRIGSSRFGRVTVNSDQASSRAG